MKNVFKNMAILAPKGIDKYIHRTWWMPYLKTYLQVISRELAQLGIFYLL